MSQGLIQMSVLRNFHRQDFIVSIAPSISPCVWSPGSARGSSLFKRLRSLSSTATASSALWRLPRESDTNLLSVSWSCSALSAWTVAQMGHEVYHQYVCMRKASPGIQQYQ